MKEKSSEKLQLSEAGQELHERFTQFHSAPVLFIGAGVSKRYLGLPSWTELLEKLASYTQKDYAYYRAKANSDLPSIAELLAEPFSDIIWEEKYSKLRLEFEADLQKNDSAIKIFISDLIRSLKETNDKDLLEEIALLKDVVTDAIITTNYDPFIESIFPDYKVYVGQDELLLSDPRGVGEIYQIHGSAKQPNSLVITAGDYKDFDSRNAYLSAKLMTLFAEHPVIFIGYSLTDENITKILEGLVGCLKKEHLTKLQDRLYFVKWSPHEKPSIASSVIKIQNATLPVVQLNVPDFKELYTILGSLRRKFSAHMLRRLKDHVYQLVLTGDPSDKLYVADFDDAGEGSQPDVVFGVGMKAQLGEKGYSPITRNDLIDDILHDKNNYDSRSIVLETLPTFINQGNSPYLKYMLDAGFIDADEKLINSVGLDPKVISRFEKKAAPLLATVSARSFSSRIARKWGTFAKLVESEDFNHILLALPSVPYTTIKPEELLSFLVQHADEGKRNGTWDTNFVKAVCLYERLRYLRKP